MAKNSKFIEFNYGGNKNVSQNIIINIKSIYAFGIKSCLVDEKYKLPDDRLYQINIYVKKKKDPYLLSFSNYEEYNEAYLWLKEELSPATFPNTKNP